MNKQNKSFYMFVGLVFALCILALTGCKPKPRVGELRTESQSVELGSDESVEVEINFGAGDLKMDGSAEKLLEADFTYNVAELKPEVEFAKGTLVVQQPQTERAPDMRGITDFRNEWNLHLYKDMPMNLRVDMGAGSCDLKLADLSLTALDVKLGAAECTIDLNGAWARDLDVTIDTGAANIVLLLPKDVGVRIMVDRGPTVLNTTGLTQDGDFYSNAAYGVSDVTLNISLKTGIGTASLVVEE